MEGQDEYVKATDAFFEVAAVLGIKTPGAFTKWRQRHGVPVLHMVRRSDLNQALAESRTREESNKSRSKKQ